MGGLQRSVLLKKAASESLEIRIIKGVTMYFKLREMIIFIIPKAYFSNYWNLPSAERNIFA